MNGVGELTPTQRRIMALLSDGLGHTHAELKSCLEDELAGETAVPYHISILRRKLETNGKSIVYRMGGYRMVRLMPLDD